MKYLLSFAQDGEDVILFNMLENVIGPVRYIDVGANDPVNISVTKLFSNMGGFGINIEPQANYIEKLNDDRPLDINIQAGIGNEEGSLVLYGRGTGASFHADAEMIKLGEQYTVPITTLKKVWDTYLDADSTVHFLKIDVEGWEKQVLEGMDFSLYRPWIVCMESTEPGNEAPSWEEWEDILLTQDYQFVGMSGINRYYVASERKNSIQPFLSFDELKEKYKVIQFGEIKQKSELKKKLWYLAVKIYSLKIMAPVRFIYRTIKYKKK